VKCPILIIHGTPDNVIPVQQGKTLADNASHELRNASKVKFDEKPNMQHHTGKNFSDDVVDPIKDFFDAQKLDLTAKGSLKLPDDLFRHPGYNFQRYCAKVAALWLRIIWLSTMIGVTSVYGQFNLALVIITACCILVDFISLVAYCKKSLFTLFLTIFICQILAVISFITLLIVQLCGK